MRPITRPWRLWGDPRYLLNLEASGELSEIQSPTFIYSND